MAKDHPTGQSGLYQAFLQLKTPEQCYRFLQDVCSYSELSAMEQRYNIAEMLVDKRIYTEIMDKTGASSAIISRVSRVLSANDSVLRALLEAEKAADRMRVYISVMLLLRGVPVAKMTPRPPVISSR